MKFAASRVLTDDFPRRAYRPSFSVTLDDVIVKGLHYGQRKLLLSEIEFLSAYLEGLESSNKPILVVYAGAANGSHLPFLFSMFETVKFVLIDPAPFCKEVLDIARRANGPILELVEGYCTDEVCLRLSRLYSSSYDILLVSDIRSGVPCKQSNKENTAMIMRDNEMQRSWCCSLRATAALLKFHPPYPRCKNRTSPLYDEADDTPETVEYMDGTRLFGVWAPKSSSEVRLCVVGPFVPSIKPAMRVYDCTVHEEQCYFYNTDNRYTRDCEAERIILERYLALCPNSLYFDSVALSDAISKFLRFSLFTPLRRSFTEDDARWVTLVYSTRDAKLEAWVEQLRGLMTVNVVRDLVKKWRNATSIPTDVTIGDVRLTRDFWEILCAGNLVEAYSFPHIRWRFPREVIVRRSKRSLS